MKIRKSSIELLKVIAIALIIISHAVPYGIYSNYQSRIDLGVCTNRIDIFILVLFRYLGQIGNCIFILCSAYFLLDKNELKIKKVFEIILYTFLVSATLLIGSRCLNIYRLSLRETVEWVLPIISNSYWFITCYIILYLIHGLLNKIIKNTGQKELLGICLFLIVFWDFINILSSGRFYYNELFGFIMVYFIVGYVKYYMQNYSKNVKINRLMFVLAIFVLIIGIALINFLGLKYKFFSNKLLIFNKFNNPIVLFMCISLFNIFLNQDFSSKFINYISGLSLLIYIVHGHYSFQNYYKGLYYDSILPNITSNLVLGSIILAIIYLFIGIIGAIIYKLVFGKVIDIISTKISNLLSSTYDKFYNKVAINKE